MNYCRLLIFLILCGCAFAQVDVSCLSGGGSADPGHAGFFAGIAPSNAHSGAGQDHLTDAGLAVANDGGDVQIIANNDGDFIGIAGGNGVDVTWNDTGGGGSGIPDVYLSVVVDTGANPDTMTLDLAWNALFAGDDVDVVIGGAVPIIDGAQGLQWVLDHPLLGTAAGNNVDIYITGAGTVTATLEWDTGGGTTTTRKRMWATDAAYAYTKGGCTLTSGAVLANGIFEWDDGIEHLEAHGIIFACDGAGGNDAAYGIFADGTGDGDNSVIEECTVTDATTDGLHLGGDEMRVINNEVSGCTAFGINFDSSNGNHAIIANSSHNNADGIRHRNGAGLIKGNILFDNTNEGIVESASVTNVMYDGNTSYSNGGDGFRFVAGARSPLYWNNTSVDNGEFGYNFLTTADDSIGYFAYNHASDNVSGNYQTGGDNPSDASFVNFKQGNNLNGAQADTDIFTDPVGGVDFTPKSGSELIDAGLDYLSQGEQDIGAIQEAQAGGGGGVAGHGNKSGGKQ